MSGVVRWTFEAPDEVVVLYLVVLLGLFAVSLWLTRSSR